MRLALKSLITALIATFALLGSSLTRPVFAKSTSSRGGSPLTAGQWETCAREFGVSGGNLAPCTAQEVQWSAERSGETPAQVARIVNVFAEESLSDQPVTLKAPISALRAGASSQQPPTHSAAATTTQQSAKKSSKTPAKAKPTTSTKSTAAPSIPVSDVGGSAEPASSQSGSTNPNNSLVNNDVMNLTDPACGMSGITVTQLSRCLRTGDPSVPDPLGNYQMDIHMSTGVTHPVNDVLTILESVMNVIWLIVLYILKGGLTLLGWAFSLSPFTNSATLGSVQTKLESVYNQLDSVWIDSVFVAIGAYGTYLAFVRRKQSEAIGHLGASVAAILLAMAIIHAPGTFIGKPAKFVNSFAQDAISSANLAAQNQTGTVPASKLAGLTGDLFETFADGPFCALDTNDVSWCMSPPTSVEMKAVHEAVVGDHSYEKQAKAIAVDVASRLPHSQQLNAYQTVYGSLTSTSTPATRAALFLRYPPGSTPRETLYALYTGEADENLVAKIIANQKALEGTPLGINITLGSSIAAALATSILKKGIGIVTSVFGGGGGSSKPKPLAPNKVAIQGSGGLVQRCLVLMLTVLAVVGVLLILIWLALHLVSQALLGFVLLLATPLMMLSPAFGVAGRKAFANWAKTLFGAIASKAFYAAFLGVFVLALTALQQVSTAALGPSAHLTLGALTNTATKGASAVEPEGTSGAGWGVPWVMQCLLCWAVFFKRNKIVGFFAIDPATHQQSGSASMGAMRVLGAAYAAHRLGGVAAGAAKRPINAYRANSLERKMGHEEATRDLAFDELESQELGAADRAHDHHKERAGTYKNALDRTQAQIDRIKQNPDYKNFTAWEESLASRKRVQSRDPLKEHENPHSRANLHEFNRGEDMAARLSKLEAGRSVLKQRHAQAQGVVDHGERNLHSHGQVLSPQEIANRVESRRAGVARNKSEPDAWKRAENLELASGRHMTPQRLKNIERNTKSADPVKAAAASAQLESTKRQVTARMQTSERLLEGVPTRNQFNRKGAANAPHVASEELRGAGKKDNLSERARMRQRELKHQRYTRKRLYRG